MHFVIAYLMGYHCDIIYTLTHFLEKNKKNDNFLPSNVRSVRAQL